MKKLIYLCAAIIVIGSIFMLGCKKDEDPFDSLNNEKGTIEFSVSSENLCHEVAKSSLKAAGITDAKKVIITIQNLDGSPTDYTSTALNLNEIGGIIYSQKIVLGTGSFNLTEFTLLDGDDNVIYAAPLQGSVAAQNVSQPLPIEFEVLKDQTTPITIEVVSTEGYTPEDFGYTRFPVTEVGTFSILVGVSDVISDELLTASITITNGSYNFTDTLEAKTNNVVTIKDCLTEYRLNVEKTGYKTNSQVFTYEQLVSYMALPLMIELEADDVCDILSPSTDLAANPSRTGYPSAEESDNGWGGGSSKSDINDGMRTYDGEWARGLAFGYGEWRQVTINFGQQMTFNKVIQWYHAGMNNNEAAAYKLQYWSGSAWIDIFETSDSHAFLKYPDAVDVWWYYWSTPYENTFAPVVSDKLRILNYPRDGSHTWLYEVEVYNQ